ncbi:MAG: hypothetical protein H7145_24840 [Akkermansiaceae bacterium]|nr:hypothetical protein [Armatimonadota bacterium]
MALKEINLPQVKSLPLGNGITAPYEYEFDAIMRLLDEYTQKYKISVSRSTELNQSNIPFLGMIFVLLIMSLITIIAPLYLGKHIFTNISTAVICLVAIVTLALISRTVITKTSAQVRLVRYAQIFLRSRLENIVRIASQMHEHSPLTASQKLEADMRLAEADMVLQFDKKVR